VINLKTARDVVDALGGRKAVSKLLGASNKRLWNWVGRYDRFPATTYVKMQKELQKNKKRVTAPAWLWNMQGEARPTSKGKSNGKHRASGSATRHRSPSRPLSRRR
jgi:hypothetical protein